MSREIKFRAWDKKRGKYVYLASLDNNGVVQVTEYGSVPGTVKPIVETLNPDEVILEQYTGHTDKSGKEIYEGDIADDGFSRCRIRWSEHFAAFEAVDEYGGCRLNIWFVAKYSEVIGNIHEDAELLGGENAKG